MDCRHIIYQQLKIANTNTATSSHFDRLYFLNNNFIISAMQQLQHLSMGLFCCLTLIVF